MIFFPYKVDLNLNRFPIWTILIILICIGVHFAQQASFRKIIKYAETFCTQEHSRAFWLAIEKVSREAGPLGCAQAMLAIHNEIDHAGMIEKLAKEATPYETISIEAGRRRNVEQLTEAYESFGSSVPKDLTRKLVYDPRSYKFETMVSAAFAHGGWDHLIGNLFFFFAFAATVEAIVGFLVFPLLILGLCLGTQLAYSLWTLSTASSIPTLGLSGVVMGMIGLFTYFLPTAGIKCFVWVLIWLRTFVIPAWILMVWFVGWDIYHLAGDQGETGINLMAHVSGAAMGLLLGLLFFRMRRQDVQEDFQAVSRRF